MWGQCLFVYAKKPRSRYWRQSLSPPPPPSYCMWRSDINSNIILCIVYLYTFDNLIQKIIKILRHLVYLSALMVHFLLESYMKIRAPGFCGVRFAAFDVYYYQGDATRKPSLLNITYSRYLKQAFSRTTMDILIIQLKLKLPCTFFKAYFDLIALIRIHKSQTKRQYGINEHCFCLQMFGCLPIFFMQLIWNLKLIYRGDHQR